MILIKRQRYTMQQDELDGYYNILFENEFNVNELKDLLIERFPTSNIIFDIDDEYGAIEHRYNDDKFDISISIFYLKKDDVYDFKDVKIRALLYVGTELQISSFDIMNFLQTISKKFKTKIYVPIEDVEKVLPSLGNIKTWCIDNDKRKIVFDLEELSGDSLNHYCDYLLFP